MKRLISAILVIAVAVSAVFISAFGTSAQTAPDLALIKAQCENRAKDIALSGAAAGVTAMGDDEIMYFSSHYPYEEITYDGCTVYGYVGDADGDGVVTILDASLIQLHLVNKKTLSENGFLLSDADGDDSITILDASTIQLFLVGKIDNEYVTHTVFAFVEETDRTLAFDMISEMIMGIGTYEEEGDFYYVEYYDYYGEDVLGIVAVYIPEYKAIQIESALYSPENELMVDSVIDIFRGMSVFVFDSFMSDANLETFYFDTIGNAELASEDPDVFDIECGAFESEYYSDFSEVEELCCYSFSSAIDGLNSLVYSSTGWLVVRDLFR